ncbi:MAG: amidohydrolase family protein [Deltaproteobacteria bacterium]|nr:amidohydrolase family protein [Deltaproteobacteria bacterium]
MAFDLLVKGGLVVDGTGAPARRADVGIKDGRIVEVGADLSSTATRTLDADGAIVTPGFTDLHTHYDGQVSWDGDMAPSSLHGVTTAVMGNCGVGFAPVRERDRKRLVELMEGVEDIPGAALAEGISWEWESFAEYLDAIDRRPRAVDVVAQVTHDPLRVFVMGERAFAGNAANDDDIEKMRALVRDALVAGAAGFSTGRTDNHRSVDGSATPAAEATVRELTGIAKALEGLPHGVLQAVSDFDMERSSDRFDGEFDVLEKMAEAAPGHPLSISLMQRDLDTTQWKKIIARAEKAEQRGVVIRLQVGARGIGVLLGFEATFHPFMGFPSYKAIATLPLEERVRRMRDPALRAKMLGEKSEPIAGDGSNVPPMADRFLANIDMISMRMFRLGERPNYEPPKEESLFAEAMKTSRTPLEVIYDALLENEGKQLLYFPVYNYAGFDLDVVHEMLSHPLALPGLSDGGAHVGTVCDASFPTFMLTHWARDRARGKFPLERVVKMLTQDTSRYIGLRDRGTVAAGQRADLNVIDFEKLCLLRPQLVKDLPAGGKRLVQRAEGYRATLVAGQPILENGELTGAKPGRVARL